jgi:hypothetical protein
LKQYVVADPEIKVCHALLFYHGLSQWFSKHIMV